MIVALKDSGRAHQLMSELKKRQTMNKLGGGRHSYFSTSSGVTDPVESPPRRSSQLLSASTLPDATFDALSKKLQGLSESVEDHLLALAHLFDRADTTKRK